MLSGKAKLFRHGKARTLYIGIPSGIVQDSVFPMEEGDEVLVQYDLGLRRLIISLTQAQKKKLFSQIIGKTDK